MNKLNIIYLGNNNPRIFKRGVENVIYSQRQSVLDSTSYYIFFGEKDSVFKWDNIICISIKDNWKKIFKYNYLISKIKRKHQTIIHSHGPVRTILSVFKTDILTVHDAIYYQRKGLKQRFYQIFYFVEKLAYARSRVIHFISEYSKTQALLSSNNEKKAIIIYNTTPLEQIIKDVPHYKYRTITSDPSFYTLFAVRGIQERTRIDLLIDFAEYCKDFRINGKKIRIIVAGKGPLLEYYRNVIIEKGLTNIKLLGFISDPELCDFYKSSDCVIITCDHAEGFGLPIIEGYCCNRPVIGSNKCAIPEIIIDKAFLFENNSKSIYNTLISIYNRDFNYQEFYDSHYSAKVYNDKFKQVYYQIINSRK